MQNDILSDKELMKMIYIVAHKCVMVCEEVFKKYDLTFPQSILLHTVYVNKDKDICQKDIVDLYGVKGPSISSLINNLCKKGYIIRTSCKDDGRKYIIKLTEKGFALINKMEEDNSFGIADVFNKLSESERESLANLLLKIA